MGEKVYFKFSQNFRVCNISEMFLIAGSQDKMHPMEYRGDFVTLFVTTFLACLVARERGREIE